MNLKPLMAVFILTISQSLLYAQQEPPIRIAPFLDEDTEHLTLTWAPANDTIWSYGLKYGYTISKVETNKPAQVIASEILPQSKSWFEANRHEDKGFIEVIEEILFAPVLNIPDLENGSYVPGFQYHYLVPEAIKSPLIAHALGLSYTDITYVPGNAYTYIVAVRDSLGTVYQSEIYISEDVEDLFLHQHDLDDMKFLPPGGVSLFDMRGDLPEYTRIETIAKPMGDSIVLRWAPNNDVLWSRAKSLPYAIFRKEFRKISSDSTWSDYVLLDSITPWPLEKYTLESVGQDSMVLIAAQSMFGAQESTDKDGILMQRAESNMRYGMAMLAADRSAKAAEALGLRFVDKDVVPDRAYSYLIMNRAVDNFIENGYIEVVNMVEGQQQVEGFYAQSKDLFVELIWSGMNRSRYSGYILYRSDDDGKSVRQINESPLLFIDNEYSREDGDFIFQDSITTNYRDYTYYIRGIDAFGDTSQAVSLTTYGIDKTPPEMPAVYWAEADAKGDITLKWEIVNAQQDLDKFHLLLSSSVDGSYETIAVDLPATTRSYVFDRADNVQNSYYFIVIAQDTAGNQQPTLPVFVQLIDSIAPAPPAYLQGLIDSTGKVTITWAHGVEPDLAGYKVYMGNNPAHEFSQITVEPTPLNMWHDTITLQALDKHVYYKVVAVDKSNNHSEFSALITLKRPDIIPPSAPATLPASSDGEGVKVRWSLSPSNDVVAYIIYRRNVSRGDTAHTRVARIQDKFAGEWLDTSAVYETLYEYVIKAQDQSGLLSESSFPAKGRRMFDLNVLKIDKFEATYRKDYNAVYLQWYHSFQSGMMNSADKYYFYLYKKVDGGSWKKLKQLDSSALSYLDRELNADGNYTYGIKLVLSDGKTGSMMESKAVALKKG